MIEMLYDYMIEMLFLSSFLKNDAFINTHVY